MGDVPFLPTPLECTPSWCQVVNRGCASRLSVLLIYLSLYSHSFHYFHFIYLPLTVYIVVASATQSWATSQVAPPAGKPYPGSSSCISFPEAGLEAKKKKSNLICLTSHWVTCSRHLQPEGQTSLPGSVAWGPQEASWEFLKLTMSVQRA